MAAEIAPYGRKTQRPPAVKEVHIVWIKVLETRHSPMFGAMK